MSLLDDLNDEYHQDLLENGNLRGKPRAVSWSDDNSWTSQGYLARVQITSCACGANRLHLIGVFHRETTPSGKAREQRLDDRATVPLNRAYPVLYEATTARICPSCLGAKGFDTGNLDHAFVSANLHPEASPERDARAV